MAGRSAIFRLEPTEKRAAAGEEPKSGPIILSTQPARSSAMAKVNEQWTVGPHGPLERIDEGLLSVAGEIVMPLGRFPRRMTIAALSGGRLAVWSPIPLREPEMAELERLGTIAFL